MNHSLTNTHTEWLAMKSIRNEWKTVFFSTFNSDNFHTLAENRNKMERHLTCISSFGWKISAEMMSAFVFFSLSLSLFLGLISTLFEFTYKVSLEEKALNFDRLAFLWFCVNVELALSIPHSPFRYSLPIVLICCCCYVCAESVCLTFRWQKYDIDLFDKSLLMAFAIFVSLSSCSFVQSFGSFVPQRTHISSIHDHPNEFKQTNEFK